MGIDTTKFDQGRRRVESNVRQMKDTKLDFGLNERAIQTAFQKLNQGLTQIQATARRVGLTPELLRQIKTAQSGMTGLQNQARTMGVALEAGAKRGSYGIAALGSAGLAAYA